MEVQKKFCTQVITYIMLSSHDTANATTQERQAAREQTLFKLHDGPEVTNHITFSHDPHRLLLKERDMILSYFTLLRLQLPQAHISRTSHLSIQATKFHALHSAIKILIMNFLNNSLQLFLAFSYSNHDEKLPKNCNIASCTVIRFSYSCKCSFSVTRIAAVVVDYLCIMN